MIVEKEMQPIIGHEWAVEFLKSALAKGRVAHAYLFVGPPQIGKRTLALYFAQALNCLNERRPCGECSSCRKISRGLHPDVRLIESEGGTIKIEQIRDVQREVALSPFEGDYRIYLIREIERATLPALNCLLKTLEEPPKHVVLLLTSTEISPLPETVVSRCQVLSLRPPPLGQIEEALEQHWQVQGGRARLLARLSEGRIGWAITAAREQGILQERERRLGAYLEVMEKGQRERLDYAYQLSRDPEVAEENLKLWLSWWRDLLLLKGGLTERVVNVDQEATLRQQCQQYSLQQARDFLRAIQQTLKRLEQNVNARLALEVLLLDLPTPRDGT